jgi:two-component system, OmpR family, heavy metal sensor histidine kinase CusS
LSPFGAAEPTPQRWFSVSLALRLALLYAVATSILLLALGTALGFMLRQQLEARDLEELDGKTEIVQHLLGELKSKERIRQQASRVADLSIGHPHLLVGLREGSEWLVEPMSHIGSPLVPKLDGDVVLAPRIDTYLAGTDRWWLRRVQYRADDGSVFDAYVGLHVSPAQILVERLFRTLLIAGVTGVVLGALLGWVVARRGLAPLETIGHEAERVTADRLGTFLRAEDAPSEIRGMVESINRMLDRLRASFRTLEEFSADIAHELRTPISNLMLQTQVTLARPRGIDEYQEALHSNLAELEQLQRMVSDMLFLARADRGMLQLQFEPVQLGNEARSLAEFYELAAGEEGKSITVSGDATVMCDRSMARRAITNLLSNAVRYAPGGSKISVDVATSADRGAVVAVTNRATRLSDPELSRLFGRFARGESGAHAAGESTGLGLSIVASIMRRHCGVATAASEDSAITLRLVFPAARVAA